MCAVGECVESDDEVARTGVRTRRAVGQLVGAVGRFHQGFRDVREADGDLCEELLAHLLGDGGADGFTHVRGDVADDDVRGVVGRDGESRGHRVHRVVLAQRRCGGGEVGRDGEDRSDVLVREGLLRFRRRHRLPVESLVGVEQFVREVLAQTERVPVLGRRGGVLVDDRSGDRLQVARGVLDRPHEETRVDEGDEGQRGEDDDALDCGAETGHVRTPWPECPAWTFTTVKLTGVKVSR